ncbi:MAG: AEC family transporter [Rhodobacteraceae bacterium]|nr:AEC family transporter [Paracoccaceae bacterium]
MSALLTVILPVFLVVGAGYLCVWRQYFAPAVVDGLMKFTQGFAIPCLLFRAIARIDLSSGFDPALLGTFYAGALCGFIAGILGARLIFKRDWEAAVAIGFACLFSNSVLLGLPITEQAFGPDALVGNFAIVALHAPFCYAVDLIARAALPAALFGLGGMLVRYRPEGDMRTILFICAVSLILHPAIVFGLGVTAGLDRDAFRSAVLTAAMAPGVNAYVFSDLYGAARRVVASSVLIATALTVLTAWVWLALLP